MTETPAGFWPCKVIDGFYGDVETRPGLWLPMVRINVEISEGPGKGTRHTYEDEVNNKQAPYIVRTCKAVGWRCQTLSTLKDDVAAWVNATGGISTVEIKHLDIKKGKKFDAWVASGRVGPGPIWVKANSIGRGPRPSRESSSENLNDADDLMRRALAEDGGYTNGSGGGGYDPDAPPPPSDPDQDIPFISCAMDRALWR